MRINESNEGKLKGQLGSWYPLMKELIESDTWDALYRFLKAESSRGVTICPKSSDVWKSLQMVDRTKVKAIFLLQCPYANIRQGTMVASGVPMSCENIAPYQQPSLFHWWSAITEQYGFNPEDENRGDISFLLEEEHILLLNVSGTTAKDKPDSHLHAWTTITQWFIENVINKYLPGIPIVLVGGTAAKFEKFLNPLSNPIKKIEHMAAAAHSNRDWKHQDVHLWVDSIIRANNGESEVPRWTRRKNEVADKDNIALQEWLKPMKNENDEVGDLPWQKKT